MTTETGQGGKMMDATLLALKTEEEALSQRNVGTL